MSAATASFLALSCVGAFATAPALAGEPRNVAPLADDDQHRDDILVTGQRQVRSDDPKQVAPLINTPRSIVVLPSEVIAQTGSNSLQDALRTVPGITLGAAEGGNPIGDRPFIRGFDSQGSIYVDGVRDLASQTREVFATDSVQIVRGSDSTLGGRGSAGGTINIVSKLPKLENAGALTASYGNADYKRVSGDLNLAVSDTAALRVEGVWHDQDFAGRDAIHARRWGIAPSFAIGLGTPTRLIASYYYLQSHELPDSGIPYLYTIANAPGTGIIHTRPAPGRITTASGQTGTVDRSAFFGLADRDFRDATTRQATLRAEHDFGGVTLRNTARFNDDAQSYIYTQPDDSQGNVYGTTTSNAGGNLTSGGYVWRRANSRYSAARSLIDQIDLFGTLHTGAITHSFAIGSEFSWERTRRGTFVVAAGATGTPRCTSASLARFFCTSLFAPTPLDPWANYSSDTSSVRAPTVKNAPTTETQNDAATQAVYGFDSITLTPRLIVNLGARYDRFTSTQIPPSATQVRLRRTDGLFNWQAGLVFKPMRETSLYANYATAATPPNSLLGEGREDNAIPTTNSDANLTVLASLRPQKTRSYEVGAKASLLGERLQLAAAAFQTDIDNARVQIDATTVAFVGQSRIRGIELTASGTILPGWTVFGGYTHLDPRIIDGGNAALAVPAAFGRGATSVYVPSVNSGKQLPQTARNSLTATSNVTIRRRFQLGGSAIYMSRQFGGYADNRSASQDAAGAITVTPATKVLYREIPGYWRFDARASVDLTRRVTFSVNAQNLTDRVYFTQANASHYAAIAPGRSVFGTINVHY